MENVIPQDVEDFILLHIDTIAQLEGLLLFHSEPDWRGSAADIAKRLYISDEEANLLLRHLLRHKFIDPRPSEDDTVYRYAARNGQTFDLIAKLAETYSRYLVPVTHLVHTKPKNKIQQFADAFWIRKETGKE